MREAAPSAYGQPCTRCGKVMEPGQPISPDHLDGGGPQDCAGYAHVSCNVSAGVSRGNAMRAAAYRAAKGLPDPPAAKAAGNGATVAEPARPPRPAEGIWSWSEIHGCWVRNSREW
jgi:hypothetical protein